MQISGNFCPVCKRKNEAGATTCSYCGNPLSPAPENAAANRDPVLETKFFMNQTPEDLVNDIETAPPSFQGLVIYHSGPTPIAILQDTEFYIGRDTEESGERLIDLIPYDAFQLGVSRKHAMIRQSGTGYEIIDLDSTNGTWINSQRLRPNQPYPFFSGTQIRLGRLILTFVYAPIPR